MTETTVTGGQIPSPVKAIVAVQVLQALIQLGLAVLYILGMSFYFLIPSMMAGPILVIIGLLGLVVARGLLKLRYQSYRLAVVLNIVALVIALMGENWINLVLSFVIVWGLAAIKSAFTQ